jgi:preprotein translocase subunit SecE
MADKLKLLLAILVFAAGIGAYITFEEQYSTLIRVGMVLAAFAVGIVIALQAETGRAALGFVRDARTEVRKVVWPTRKETVQTSLMVIVMVVVIAIFLWILDSILFWAVSFITGHGS